MPDASPQPWVSQQTAVEFFQTFKLKLLECLPVLSVCLAVLGVGLAVLGWWQLQFQASAQETSFIDALEASSIPSESPPAAAVSSPSSMRVHIAGAVRKPGVYELVSASVLQDLVIKAGGLSGLVWQDYLDAHINLAEPLQPNQKIWIPTINQQTVLEPMEVFGEKLSPAIKSTTSAFISINTALVAELDMLAGIGQKRAEDIVANRPYAAIDELVTKAKVPQSVVDAVKNQLSL